MRNIKNIIIGFSVVLSACGTLEETPNRLVKTQFDFYCRSEACDNARNYLYDHKLVANEEKDMDEYQYTYSGKKIIKALNAEYEEKPLNTECMKVAQKLIDDRYKGCMANTFDKMPHDVGDKHYTREDTTLKGWYWGTIHGVEKRRTSLHSKISPEEHGNRQCAIEMFNQVRQFATICESNFWEEHPDTASFLKEMADDGILQSGIVRSSMSFYSLDPKNNEFKPQYGDEEELPKEAEISLAANPVYYHRYIEREYDKGLPMEIPFYIVKEYNEAKAQFVSELFAVAQLYIGLLDPYGMVAGELKKAFNVPSYIPIPTKKLFK